MDLGPRTGSRFSISRAPASRNVSATAVGAVWGSMSTAFPALPSALSAGVSVAASATSAIPSSACRSSGVILALSRKSVGRPACGTMAKPSTKGVFGTSRPRMLNSQQIDSGSVSTVASALSAPSVARSSVSLSAAVLPARLWPRNSMGLTGGAGRSVQMASTRLACGTTRAWPASFSVMSRTSPGVCSQGS